MSDGGSCSQCSVAEIPCDRVWRGSSSCCRRKCDECIHDWTCRQESEAGRGWRWRRDRYCLGTNGVLRWRRRVSRGLSYGEGLSARVNVCDGTTCPCSPVAKVPAYRVGSLSSRCDRREGHEQVHDGA